MPRWGLVLVSTLAVAGATSCQRSDESVKQKLDEISRELAEIRQLLERGAQNPGVARQRPQAAGRPRPNPRDVYSIDVEGAPIKGPKNARVTIVKAFEFACPFCERVIPTLNELLERYPGEVRIAYKHFVVHPQAATIPAQASCAAARQGRFDEMYRLIWDKGFKANRNFGSDNMMKLAKELGLDLRRFESDMEACLAVVRQDQAELGRVGTTGTPAFYVNGRYLAGARPVDQFASLVDEELEKANERIRNGEATAENYYKKFVVERGKKSVD